MALSAQAQAVVLLTAHLGKAGKGEARPLSPTEWGRFALWLKDRGLQPEELLSDEPARLLGGWLDKTVTLHRIEALLGRGAALGLALDKWERAGLWVMTRSDPDYPERLKRRLKSHSPPVFFGCGNRILMGNGGLAVVGSRDAAEPELAFAAMLGAEAASQGKSIVSGGARGIDEAAMLGALKHEGTTVGVLADSLLRTATSAKYRPYLVAKDLVLVSPFHPEAGFEVGNAMARNRYIYCLADAAVVVSSSLNKGGSWTGAIENLKEGWAPLWVKESSNPASGNAELAHRGARWLPDAKVDVAALMSPAEGVAKPELQRSLLDVPVAASLQRAESVREISQIANGEEAEDQQTGSADECRLREPEPFYEFFLFRMRNLAAPGLLTFEQLQTCFNLTRPQLTTWLKRGVAEGHIKKLAKPARYQWGQPSLFGDDESRLSVKVREQQGRDRSSEPRNR